MVICEIHVYSFFVYASNYTIIHVHSFGLTYALTVFLIPHPIFFNNIKTFINLVNKKVYEKA